MKNINKAILFTLAITMYVVAGVFAQEPANIDTTDAAITVPATDVPDTLTFNFDGQVVKVPTVTIQNAIQQGAQVVVTIKKQAQDDPPKNTIEWIMLIVGVLASSTGLTFITNLRKVASDVVNFFGKEMHPVNFVILISGAIAAGITLLWNAGKFDTIFFIGLWPTVFGLTTFVYLKFLKKDKEDEAAK